MNNKELEALKKDVLDFIDIDYMNTKEFYLPDEPDYNFFVGSVSLIQETQNGKLSKDGYLRDLKYLTEDDPKLIYKLWEISEKVVMVYETKGIELTKQAKSLKAYINKISQEFYTIPVRFALIQALTWDTYKGRFPKQLHKLIGTVLFASPERVRKLSSYSQSLYKDETLKQIDTFLSEAGLNLDVKTMKKGYGFNNHKEL